MPSIRRKEGHHPDPHPVVLLVFVLVLVCVQGKGRASNFVSSFKLSRFYWLSFPLHSQPTKQERPTQVRGGRSISSYVTSFDVTLNSSMCFNYIFFFLSFIFMSVTLFFFLHLVSYLVLHCLVLSCFVIACLAL